MNNGGVINGHSRIASSVHAHNTPVMTRGKNKIHQEAVYNGFAACRPRIRNADLQKQFPVILRLAVCLRDLIVFILVGVS